VPLRAVTVDLWGTLLFEPPGSDDRHKSRRLAELQRILDGAGVAASADALDRGYRECAGFLSQLWLQNRDVPVEDHVRVILRAVDPDAPKHLPAETVQALADAYARAILAAPPALAEGAPAALESLARQGYTLCLVSNTMRTPGRALREVLSHYGVLDRFAHLTFSDECGVRKPEPQIFRRTLEAVGVAPGEAVHVGDDPVLDVEGARRAGMRVIQVTSQRPAWFGPQRPHATIPTLATLPEAIAKLAGRRR
jgi:HAD superfamily hydrolase (TIGR01662 family)